MGGETGIQWTDATFNPWVGCSKVSPGCAHCYAEAMDRRWGRKRWGAGQARSRTSPSYWKQPHRWAAAALDAGVRRRVFCASMADVFDEEVPPQWRADLFELIRATPSLDWQLLTKRPQHLEAMLPADWGDDGWSNVWLGVSAEDQEHLLQRLPLLLESPARVHFVSYEPALGPLDPPDEALLLDWIIVGGESGTRARPFNLDWARRVVEWGRHTNTAVFVKQLGGSPYEQRPAEGPQGTTEALRRLGAEHPQRRWFTDWCLTHAGGETYWMRHLQLKSRKGGVPEEWPEELRVREFPGAPK